MKHPVQSLIMVSKTPCKQINHVYIMFNETPCKKLNPF